MVNEYGAVATMRIYERNRSAKGKPAIMLNLSAKNPT
jgi:hypothetical protein